MCSGRGWDATCVLLLFDLEVFRRHLSPVTYEFVLDLLTFIQSAQSGPFDRRDMNEYIFTAISRLDESVPFCRVEPFHHAARHCRSLTDGPGDYSDRRPGGQRGNRVVRIWILVLEARKLGCSELPSQSLAT